MTNSYDAIVTEVTLRLGGRTDIAARVGTWINMAWLELLQSPRFSFFELDATFDDVVLSGATTFSLIPIGTFWFILDVIDRTNSRRLEPSSIKVFDDLIPTTGQVQRYARFANFIQFDPTPDANFNIRLRFRRRPTRLESGTLFDGIGDEWEEPLTILSVIKGWEALDQRDKAMEQRQLLEPILAMREDVPNLEQIADNAVTIMPITQWRGA